jgi:hypothetical protein
MSLKPNHVLIWILCDTIEILESTTFSNHMIEVASLLKKKKKLASRFYGIKTKKSIRGLQFVTDIW